MQNQPAELAGRIGGLGAISHFQYQQWVVGLGVRAERIRPRQGNQTLRCGCALVSVLQCLGAVCVFWEGGPARSR